MNIDDEKKGFSSGRIGWASHIYAKLSLNPYKIRKLKNWVFTYFYKNEESFNNFIIGNIGKKLKYGL